MDKKNFEDNEITKSTRHDHQIHDHHNNPKNMETTKAQLQQRKYPTHVQLKTVYKPKILEFSSEPMSCPDIRE